MTEDKATFEGWTILELMGHRKLAGWLSEQEIGGASFLRLDIPASDGVEAATQYYSPAALYCITPTTEDMVKRICSEYRPAPVQRWELPEPQSRINVVACRCEICDCELSTPNTSSVCMNCRNGDHTDQEYVPSSVGEETEDGW